jgi:hypothetical protein
MKGNFMFETIEIRRAANGFILTITTDDDTHEYVYDTSRKVMRIIKQFVEADSSTKSKEEE